MTNRNDMNPLEQTVVDLSDYAKLKADGFKLRLLDNFSTLLNNIFAVLIVVILACFALTFMMIAATWGLSILLNSIMAAVLVMGGLFIIAAVVTYAYRKKLIINPTMRMLNKLMFEKENS